MLYSLYAILVISFFSFLTVVIFEYMYINIYFIILMFRLIFFLRNVMVKFNGFFVKIVNKHI